ncbi:hypothetical protein D3C72_2141060 [compost metagenome]
MIMYMLLGVQTIKQVCVYLNRMTLFQVCLCGQVLTIWVNPLHIFGPLEVLILV